jgi:hypothetical protein
MEQRLAIDLPRACFGRIIEVINEEEREASATPS